MDAPIKDRFCSYCGTAFEPPLLYPRTCPSPACNITLWANPIPVCVLLVPVRDGDRLGLLIHRRGIERRAGYLALPGGFLEEHESWQVGAARELHEELDLTVDPETLQPTWYASTTPRPNRVLLFCEAPVVEVKALPKFKPDVEAPERGAVWGAEGLDPLMAFTLHMEAIRRWFEARGIDAPHGYRQL
jgi:ADP-ribose pyrophosphatase YjhB (NUDIX family)